MSPLRVDDVPRSSEREEYERSEVERSPQGGVFGEKGPLMRPPEVLGLLCFYRSERRELGTPCTHSI
jgi:hypothetical protein